MLQMTIITTTTSLKHWHLESTRVQLKFWEHLYTVSYNRDKNGDDNF